MSRWDEGGSPLGPVAKPLFMYLNKNLGFCGTPAELVEVLQANTDRSDWWRLPADCDEMADVLMRLRTWFLRYGYGYTPNDIGGQTRVTIDKLGAERTAALAKSWKRRKRWAA